MASSVFVIYCYFHTSWCCLFWVWRKCTGNIACTLCKYTIHMQVKYERSWDTMYHHGITVNNFFQEVSYTWTFTGIYMYHKNNFFVFSCLDSGSNQYDDDLINWLNLIMQSNRPWSIFSKQSDDFGHTLTLKLMLFRTERVWLLSLKNMINNIRRKDCAQTWLLNKATVHPKTAYKKDMGLEANFF